ncbi:C13 family peptidase [Photobacterium leiognathi]|uniref:C13 family peptidase n=1 Tax=Photobacterium leiognathi TaxID=553611 RepID=UPI002980D068|nr:C13 family peptidase [Photobacterium leiognathi]
MLNTTIQPITSVPKLILIALSFAILSGCASKELLLAQPSLVEQQTSKLLPQRPNKTDLYFVGFAADSSQNVFSKEVKYAQQLFDNKFDTKGRSVTLINHSSTINEAPMATLSNLDNVLKNIGNTIDKNEDIVFLFLTGHGSFEKGLHSKFWPHHKELITPKDLKKSLIESKIKWKVVVVSSCFSGQFANEIADLHTLVITASNPSQPSFGCTNTSEFTYFGEAFFKEQLAQNASFIMAFIAAKARITVKENKMGFENSQPMMITSKPIIDKLKEISQ